MYAGWNHQHSICRFARIAGLCLLWASLSPFSPTGSAAERTVVLKNGSVFSGEVTRQARGVVVQSGDRTINLSTEQVDMVVADLPAAYDKMARRLNARNTVGHEKLLQWCLRQDLPDQALSQLYILRELDPDSPQIDLWQKSIERRANASKTVLPNKAPLHPDLQRIEDLKQQLSKKTQAQFVRHVQPILFNRCGQGNCHGRATKTSYALLLGRSPLPQSVTQRNLGATLRQINEPVPQQSLFWLSATEAHGGLAKDPLTTAELEKVLNWTVLAHRDAHGEAIANASTRLRKNRTEELGDPFDPAGFNSQQR